MSNYPPACVKTSSIEFLLCHTLKLIMSKLKDLKHQVENVSKTYLLKNITQLIYESPLYVKDAKWNKEGKSREEQINLFLSQFFFTFIK